MFGNHRTSFLSGVVNMAILFLDVDGTLINYKAQIPSSAKEAVIAARKNGHFVFLCTGCSKQEIPERHFDFELDGFIGGNGNYIEVQGTEIFHKPLTYVQCKHFTDWCISRSLAYRFECNSGIYISDDYMEKSVQARMKYAFGNNKSAVNAPTNPAFRKMTSKYRDDVNKTAFVLNSYQDYLDAVKEFKDMVVGTWGGKGQLALYGDTSPEGISKEFAINKLLDYLHIDKKESICFGDSSSDLPMFNACNIKIAMKNGNDEIKQKATYIADDVDDNGVYKMFKQLQII